MNEAKARRRRRLAAAVALILVAVAAGHASRRKHPENGQAPRA